MSSLLFLHLLLLCPCLQWIWNLSHSPNRTIWPTMLQRAKPPNPPETTVPISCVFSTRGKFPSSESFKFVCSLGETFCQPLDQQQIKDSTEDAFHHDSGSMAPTPNAIHRKKSPSLEVTTAFTRWKQIYNFLPQAYSREWTLRPVPLIFPLPSVSFPDKGSSETE